MTFKHIRKYKIKVSLADNVIMQSFQITDLALSILDELSSIRCLKS